MESKNSSLAILHEPFVAGMDENLSPIMQRLWKLEGGAIYFCRSGWAHVTIDLKDYEIVENTQIVLLPGTIIRINGNSSDFTASFFGFPKEMFREACLRFEPIFFRFIKEKPCYTLKDESTGAINGLMRATTAIYNDRENRFRNQIAKIISSRLCWIFMISVTATSTDRKSKEEAGRMKSLRISSHWYMKTVSHNGK